MNNSFTVLLSTKSGLLVIARIFLLLGMLGFSVGASAQIRYVKATGTNTDPASATSWATATFDLQGAINSLTDGGEVWVAAGIYTPTTTTDRTLSFSLQNGVTIYGGFVGTETSLDQRPPLNLSTPSSTTLSGDIGTKGDPADNSYHVFNHPVGKNLDSTAVLDGVVVSDGMANGGTGNQQEGAGMYNYGSSPTLKNCQFLNNSAASRAAGMYNLFGSNPALTDCSFQYNSTKSGGGMLNYSSNPTLVNCSFIANTTDSYGGGILNSKSSPSITNCLFKGNTSSDGGGINNGEGSSPTIKDCYFLENSVLSRGAGIDNSQDSNPMIVNCRFEKNTAVYYGAGVYNYQSSPNLINCSFIANSADVWGGALGNTVSSPNLTNCSFLNNSAPTGGAIYNYSESTATLINCVLYGNGGTNSLVNAGNLGSNSRSLVKYTLMDVPHLGYNYFDQGNNLSQASSPFESSTSTRLNSCAPAINAGLNSTTALTGITTDLAGNARVYGEKVDMGAYEFHGEPNTLTVTNPTIIQATVGHAFSQSFSATGGTAPYSFTVGTGSVPPGLSLSTSGVLSGTPTQAGILGLVVLVKDAGGCLVLSQAYYLYVTDPVLALSAFEATSNPVCVGSPVTFTATVGTGTYSYTLTNGTDLNLMGSSSTALFSQTITAGSSTSPQVFTLTVSSGGSRSSATAALSVNSVPDATFSGLNPSYCANASPVTLSPVTAGGTFSGPGISGTTFTPSNAGTGGTVTYSVTVNGCTSTSSSEVTIEPAPVAVISPSSATLTCSSPSVALTASGGVSYRWEDNSTQASRNVTTAGTYSVTVTSGNGCWSSQSVTISNYSDAPVAVISPSSATLTCASPSVSLTASGGVSYRWEDNSTQAVRNVTTAGTYSVTVTSGNGCWSSQSVTISGDNAVPTDTISPSSATLTCASPSVALTASGGVSYRWEDNSTQASRNVTAGTYSVTVTSDNGCWSSTSVTISNYSDAPVAVISPSSATLTCSSPSVTLTASGGVSYRWEDNSTQAVRSVTTAGTYSVTVTSGNGCWSSTSITISSQVEVPLIPNLTSTTVTQGTPAVVLTASNCAGILSWSGPSGSSGTGPITVPTTSPGTFSYQATCTTNGCTSAFASAVVVVTASTVSGSFDGFIYGADCSTFRGWVWDRNKPNTPISVDLLDGTSVIATIMADVLRQDLLNAGKGNGSHAFIWSIPESLKDGLPHSLSARVTGNSFVLKDGPKAILCQSIKTGNGNNPPQPPAAIASLVAQLNVPFSAPLPAFSDPDGDALTYVLTGLPNGLSFHAATRTISGTPTEAGNFALAYQATDALGANNSMGIQLVVYAVEATPVTGNFDGYLDKLDCGGIRGWVWDRNKPNTPLTVEFYLEPSPGNITVLGSTLASIYRPDLKDAGKGNGAHAYHFTPPASVTNGTMVKARVLGSTFVLKGSPKAFQCNSGARLSAEALPELQVRVLGNPVSGDQVAIEIRGAEGQPLQLLLTDANGRLVTQRLVDQARTLESQTLLIGQQPAGILLLRVISGSRTVSVKVIKP